MRAGGEEKLDSRDLASILLLLQQQQEYEAERVQVLGVAVNPMAHMLVPDFQLSYPVENDDPDALKHPGLILRRRFLLRE